MASGRPGSDEYGAFYAGYVARVGDVDIVSTLADQAMALGRLLDRLGPDGAAHRYAVEKWSVAEVVGHLADAERIFGMRIFGMRIFGMRIFGERIFGERSSRIFKSLKMRN